MSSITPPPQNPPEKGIIAWFVYNPVAANLLMAVILLGGLASYFMMTKRMMPDIEPNVISVSVAYPGAAPLEVEQGIIIKIEESIQDVKGIKNISAIANEGLASVTVEIVNDIDLDDALNEIKIKIDSIATFPEEIEKPIIAKFEFSADVLWLSVYGNMDTRVRQQISQELRDEIVALPGVNTAEVLGKRDYEISIELGLETLQAYDLSLAEVAQTIRRFSVDLPGGSVKTDGGDVRIRTIGQAYTAGDYSRLVLKTFPNGTRLLLGDIATINDGYAESNGYARFNQEPTTLVRVKSLGEQNDLEVAQTVKDYLSEKTKRLPQGVQVSLWGDGSVYLQQRLDMMFKNMSLGMLLVFILLTLFLRFKVAFWVLLGIPVCFLGAFLFMDKLGSISTNINFISLFGLILVLGIVVDDAIIIGESIYREIRNKGHSQKAVIDGAKRVAMPATFGVLTTIAAFLPMLTLDNVAAPFFEAIAVVVILCLLFSLVESKWILPSHLAHMKYEPYDPKKANRLARIQHNIREKMESFAQNNYRHFLTKVANYRYLSAITFLMLLFISIGVLSSGHIKFEVFPNVANDGVQARFSINEGSPSQYRDHVIQHMEESITKVSEKLSKEKNQGQSIIKSMISWTEDDYSGAIYLELTPSELRQVNAWEIEKAWREQVGELSAIKSMRFISSTGVGGDAALSFKLIGDDTKQLELAANDLKNKLTEFKGVYDIRSSHSSASQEIKLSLKPQAGVLGITLEDLGRQVRQAFYGEEAQRIQRGKDEIKVMVRFPKEQRQSIDNLENMRIKAPNGGWVPFSQVADYHLGSSYANIQREDRKRAINIMADFDAKVIKSEEVTKPIKNDYKKQLKEKYPEITLELSGQSKESNDFLSELAIAFTAAFALIYILIAIPLKSYLQPLIVMFVIPFGFIGAVVGHLFFGKDISMMSMFGLVALMGVVVNDSLLMVDFVNRARQQGLSLMESVLDAGVKRFRAIILTSLTTFLGLFPILFETSLQAQIIIPMAISLAFGILFATLMTLLLIPALYLILEDIKNLWRSLFFNQTNQKLVD